MSFRQFDVFINSDPDTKESHPYLIVLQASVLNPIATCVVAPLVTSRKILFYDRLLPEVVVSGARYVIATPDLSAIPMTAVKSAVANLEEYRYQILGALDTMFMGI